MAIGRMRTMSFVLAKRDAGAAMEGAGLVVKNTQSRRQTSSRVSGKFDRKWASWPSCWEVEGWRRRRCS